MKKKLVLLVLMLTLAATWQVGQAGQRYPLEFTDPGQPIFVNAGDQFTIVLNSNHTTGFQWELSQPLNQQIVKKVSSAYRSSAAPPGLVGSGGTEIWTFAAKGSGRTTITFTYQRSWETTTAPAQTETFNLIVK